MKIGDRIYVRGYVDEIRKNTVIVRNDGGYFGTIPSEVITGELPSAQPEQRWIPCSERLPEVGRSVLLSVGGMYTAEGCLREDGDWTQFRWDAIQRKDMVGAWMPLPEPYKVKNEL